MPPSLPWISCSGPATARQDAPDQFVRDHCFEESLCHINAKMRFDSEGHPVTSRALLGQRIRLGGQRFQLRRPAVTLQSPELLQLTFSAFALTYILRLEGPATKI